MTTGHLQQGQGQWCHKQPHVLWHHGQPLLFLWCYGQPLHLLHHYTQALRRHGQPPHMVVTASSPLSGATTTSSPASWAASASTLSWEATTSSIASWAATTSYILCFGQPQAMLHHRLPQLLWRHGQLLNSLGSFYFVIGSHHTFRFCSELL